MTKELDLMLKLYDKHYNLLKFTDNIIDNIGRVTIEKLLPNTTYNQGDFYISWVVNGNEMSKVVVPTFKTLKYDTSHTLIVYFNDINEDNLLKLKGDSAYQIWLQQDNHGSIQDFLNSLKGEQGNSITVLGSSIDSKGNTVVKFSDNSTIEIPKGKDGESIKPSDLTENDYKKILEYGLEQGYLSLDNLTESNKIQVGKTEPTDKSKIWIDTNGGN